MATFIDRHPDSSIPHAVRRRLTHEARRSEVDPHGARPIGHWLEDDGVYCLMEAPNAKAVVQHHVDHGMRCDHLRELAGVRGTRPPGPRDETLVRASIAKYWHPARA